MFVDLAELGSVGEEGAALTTHSPNEDEKLKDVVQHFMKSLDKPERLSEEDAANIAAIKIQVRTKIFLKLQLDAHASF